MSSLRFGGSGFTPIGVLDLVVYCLWLTVFIGPPTCSYGSDLRSKVSNKLHLNRTQNHHLNWQADGYPRKHGSIPCAHEWRGIRRTAPQFPCHMEGDGQITGWRYTELSVTSQNIEWGTLGLRAFGIAVPTHLSTTIVALIRFWDRK